MKEVIGFLLTLLPLVVLYGVGVALVWLGLSYDNGWVIAAGLIFTLMLKCSLNTNTDKEEK